MTTEKAASDYVPPKVFVSYSWTSDEYADWVKDLAKRLRDDSVDVILDRLRLRPGQDKYAFMEQMVTDPKIRKVLPQDLSSFLLDVHRMIMEESEDATIESDDLLQCEFAFGELEDA